MIEALDLNVSRPTRRVVAGLAWSRETTLMRIRVTVGATLERQSSVFNVGLGIEDRNVALFANDSRVCSGEWKFRSPVIKRRGRTP